MSDIHDKLFESLANEQRRRLLFALLDEPTSISLDSPPDATGEQRMRLIERQHNHLPKLADAGFVRWSPTTDTIARGSEFEEIRPILELLSENDEQLAAVQWPRVTGDR